MAEFHIFSENASIHSCKGKNGQNSLPCQAKKIGAIMPRPRKGYDSELARQIQTLSQAGTPQADIAAIVGLSAPTLRRIYRKELDLGMAQAHAAVGQKLFEKCMAGDSACLIFYAKTQLGWRENKDQEMAKEAKTGVLIMPGLMDEAEWEKAATGNA